MRIFAAFLIASTLHAAEWITLRGSGVELVSDAGEKTARQALDQLAQMKRVLPPVESKLLPLRIFLFAKQSEYRAYAPDVTVAGFYQSGIERDYIAMATGGAMPRVVSHEYAHFAMNSPGVRRPKWLEEGLAEFYSNFDGKRLGSPIAEHLRVLERPWLTAEQLNAPSGEPEERFYALSWALVHMLRREPPFPERITAQTLVELRSYLRRMQATRVQVTPVTRPVAAVEPVSPLNALLLRADLAMRSQHPDLALKLYTQAAREFPNSSAVETGLGTLAFGAGDREGALEHLKRALELNDRDALAWFELAQIEDDHAALERAAQLNLNFAEAHVLLGVRATDAGDLDGALAHLEHATALLPRKSYAWYSLGYAQQKRGDVPEARRSLEQALRMATTAEQRAMAATLLDSLTR